MEANTAAAVNGWKSFLYPLGLLVSFGLAVLGAFLVTPHGENFENITATNEFKLWRTLIGIMLATTIASTLVTVPLAHTVWAKATPEHRWVLALSTVASAGVAGIVLFVAPLLVNVHTGASAPVMAELRFRLVAVFAIQLMFLLPTILVVIGVTEKVRSIEVRTPTIDDDTTPNYELFNEIRALRASLKSALTWLAIPVSFVVIVTGQLRDALIAENSSVETDIPVAFLLIYGVLFATVLAALYVPAYTSLRSKTRQIVDATYPYGSDDWADKHDDLSDYLGLSSGAFENAKATLGTLSPFIASLVAFLPSTT